MAYRLPSAKHTVLFRYSRPEKNFRFGKLVARVTEPAVSSESRVQFFRFDEGDTLNRSKDHLRNPVPSFNRVRGNFRWTKITPDSAPVVRINRSRRIGNSESIFQCQTALWTNLSLVALRDCHGQPGRNQDLFAGLNNQRSFDIRQEVNSGRTRRLKRRKWKGGFEFRTRRIKMGRDSSKTLGLCDSARFRLCESSSARQSDLAALVNREDLHKNFISPSTMSRTFSTRSSASSEM